MVDPNRPATLYAGTGAYGVFRSIDGAQTWTAFNSGLRYFFNDPDFLPYSLTLAIDGNLPPVVYLGTNVGSIYEIGRVVVSPTPEATPATTATPPATAASTVTTTGTATLTASLVPSPIVTATPSATGVSTPTSMPLATATSPSVATHTASSIRTATATASATLPAPAGASGGCAVAETRAATGWMLLPIALLLRFPLRMRRRTSPREIVRQLGRGNQRQ